MIYDATYFAIATRNIEESTDDLQSLNISRSLHVAIEKCRLTEMTLVFYWKRDVN